MTALHGLSLTSLHALAHATRVLVSPLVHASTNDWRAAVHASLRTLFRADQAMTILPAMGELVDSHDLDSDVLTALRGWFRGFMPDGRINLTDPVVNEWNRRRRQLGLQVYTRDIIDTTISGRVTASPFVNEALLPNQMQYWQGVYATGRGNADALLWVSHRRRHPLPDDSSATELLAVLGPAFQSGLSALYRLDGARAALDAAEAPLIVFDSRGVELHRSSAFADLGPRDPAIALLARAARLLAQRVSVGLLVTRPGPSATRVTTAHNEYALRATIVPEGPFGSGPVVVVLVVPMASAALPTPSALGAAFGLTRREAEIALHLAAGRTRKEIAAALGISAHTVRAHTERIFQKLGVTTRAAVGCALRRIPATRKG